MFAWHLDLIGPPSARRIKITISRKHQNNRPMDGKIEPHPSFIKRQIIVRSGKRAGPTSCFRPSNTTCLFETIVRSDITRVFFSISIPTTSQQWQRESSFNSTLVFYSNTLFFLFKSFIMVHFTSVFAGLSLVAGSLAAPSKEGLFSKITKRAGTPNSSGTNNGFYYSWVCTANIILGP